MSLIELGFRQGGPAGFGLRRMLRDVSGEAKGLLDRGQQKSIQTDRVVLVPGPAEEVETVRWIYDQFSEHERRESDIAAALNENGIVTDLRHPWTRAGVHQVLTNEKYIGNNVYNRRSFKLKKKRVLNPPAMWIRHNGAFEGIIAPDLFLRTQQIIQERTHRYTDEELLVHLRQLLEREGALSGLIIDQADGLASSSVYRGRFNSLLRAYSLIGYTPERDYSFIETNRHLRSLHPAVVNSTLDSIRELGGSVVHDPASGLLNINDEFTASLLIARSRLTEAGTYRWFIRLDTGLAADITVAVRMDADNRDPLDYYLFPIMDLASGKLTLREDNAASLDTYRFSTLDFFFGMAQRTKVAEIA